MTKSWIPSALSLAILASLSTIINAEELEKTGEKEAKLQSIVLTAEEQIKQSLGSSVITSEDLEKTPVKNDISEIIRRMPGVNLTGNSATGQRGNNRQIDIRGMGPENTLILVDGKPITSRNSVRYGWRGERDTRGDSNWVPADAIERIEVLRGPAAARYGSGAAGGVVNIITKKVTNEVKGGVEYYYNAAEDNKEGDSYRTSANVSGPIIKDVLSYRIYGNFNKTKPDAIDINKSIDSTAAGREGVENKDGALRLAWQINDQQSLTFDSAFSRQGNIYSGDSQLNADAQSNQTLSALYGSETNTMYRDSYSLTHEGNWDWGKNKFIAQYDKTKNKRLLEGLGGSTEGAINTLDDKKTSNLNTIRLNGEVNIPFDLYVPQNLTVGAEWIKDDFEDEASTRADDPTAGAVQLPPNRKNMESHIASFYVEDNIKFTDATDVVFGVRFDDHSKSGSNWSPSLNITQKLGDYWTLKGGIARAYKAPNLYQNAEGYLMNTRGNGCSIDVPVDPNYRLNSCILVGNDNLKPETSINKEIGVQFAKDELTASLTWFRNDYKNKIIAGTDVLQTYPIGTTKYYLLQWSNTPEALIQGLEGSVGFNWGNINWTNNFTYMIDSKDKRTGNPLSLIPVYTINSIFDYDITEQFDVNFIYTHYGRQESRKYAEGRLEQTTLEPSSVKSYGVAGINFGYKFNNNLSTRFGVSNLFDEQKLRDSTSSSQTYNEPGRAYYASLKYEF